MPFRVTKKQLGSKGRTDYGRMGNGGSVIKNPWGGPNLPWRIKRSSKVEGTDRNPQFPDASESPQTVGYPANQPSQWPVEPDLVGHTLPPPLSGNTAATRSRHNASVEHAFTRAGYQSSP